MKTITNIKQRSKFYYKMVLSKGYNSYPSIKHYTKYSDYFMPDSKSMSIYSYGMTIISSFLIHNIKTISPLKLHASMNIKKPFKLSRYRLDQQST